jgi:hypothetical protein
MLAVHTENHDSKNVSCSNKAIMNINCHCASSDNKHSFEMEELVFTSTDVQKNLSDPSISAKKLPKKRKFDPAELDELGKINDTYGNSLVGNTNNRPLIPSTTLSISGQLQTFPSKETEFYQVTFFRIGRNK